MPAASGQPVLRRWRESGPMISSASSVMRWYSSDWYSLSHRPFRARHATAFIARDAEQRHGEQGACLGAQFCQLVGDVVVLNGPASVLQPAGFRQFDEVLNGVLRLDLRGHEGGTALEG